MDAEIVPTAEELAEEEAAKHVPTKDEIRAEIIADTGFDPEADKEKIDKLVEKDYGQRLKTSKAIGAKVKAREALAKAPKVAAAVQDGSMSTADVLALSRANLPEEDVDEVLDYAKLKKISVKEAMASPVMKSYLASKVEERRAAEAAQVTSGRPADNKLDGAALLAKAESTGEVPETTEGLQALFRARIARKVGKQQK